MKTKAEELLEMMQVELSPMVESAPMGAIVLFQGKRYQKDRTDQPTWFPIDAAPADELLVVIPADDAKNFDAIEKAYADEQKANKEKRDKIKKKNMEIAQAIENASPELLKKIQDIDLQVLKAPLKKRDALIKKKFKLLGVKMGY